MFRCVPLLCLSLGCLSAEAVAMPDFLVLSAPWTPFDSDGKVDVSSIQYLAPNFRESGVNTVWTVGGMGQFDSLTMDERHALTSEWVTHGHANGLFIIDHVGTTVQADAIAMAKKAVELGADAIAAVPPFYEQSSIDNLIDWLAPVLAAAPDLPFFYYHIPGATHWSISMHDFTTQALASGKLPNFKGVKYVEDNTHDFLNCVTDPALSDLVFMWAPEPKIQSFAFPGRGTILAESYYAGTFLRMWEAFNAGDMRAAREEQQWKYDVEAIFSKHAAMAGCSSTNVKRAVYADMPGCNNSCDIGVERLPQSQTPFPKAAHDALVSDLTAVSFFNQSIPVWTPPRN